MDNVEEAALRSPSQLEFLAIQEATSKWISIFKQAPAYVELLATDTGINTDQCIVECDGIRIKTWQNHLGRYAFVGATWHIAEASIMRYTTNSYKELSPISIRPYLDRRKKRLKARGLYLEANVIDLRQEEQKRQLKSG